MGTPRIAACFGQGTEVVGQSVMRCGLAAIFQGRIVTELVETVPVFGGNILFCIIMLGFFEIIFVARLKVRVPAPEGEGLGLLFFDIEHGDRIIQVIDFFFQACEFGLFQLV